MDMVQFQTTPLGANAAPAADAVRSGKESAEARKVAQDFEAFFIGMYIETMFSGIETDGAFGGGHGEDVFRSLLNQEVGKSIVRTGGLGIADSVMREIIKMQEAE